MSRIYTRFYIACIWLACALRIYSAESFQNDTGSIRLHMQNEPHHLDPAMITSVEANFLFGNLYHGLFRYRNDRGLIPTVAQACEWSSSRQLTCHLSEKYFWSNGKNVTADDFVRAWRRLVIPGSKALGIELLKNIKNALPAFRGEVESEKLGVTAASPTQLQIDFESPDPEFLFKTTSPVLAPIPPEFFVDLKEPEKMLFNGPYVIKKWNKKKNLLLKPNPFFPRTTKSLPIDAEILFVDDDDTALKLYESGRINFLRRLPTYHFNKYSQRADFFELPMARFDYIGFGPPLRNHPILRKALALSLDYQQLKKMYKAKGVPGCPGISPRLYSGEICYRFDRKGALAALKTTEKKPKLSLYFSSLGGDDIKHMAEWAQFQWKKSGLKVDIEAREHGAFLTLLKDSPPPLFRKGVNLNRPTCLAAVEIFRSNHEDNLIQLRDQTYDELLSKLEAARTLAEKKHACTSALKYLLNGHHIIPLGPIYFAVLADSRLKDWDLNELNQLDLSEVRF